MSGKTGRGRLIFGKQYQKDNEERSRKKHEDPPKGMYEEVGDSGRRKSRKEKVSVWTL